MGLLKFIAREWRHNFPIASDTPWLGSGCMPVMEALLASRPCRVLEFGAGGSTVWFASRATEVVSFEHKRRWYRAVAKKLRDRTNVDLRLVSLPYYSEIDALPDAHYDIVLVDGRDRVECVRRSRQKLVQDGMLIVDDAHRIGTPEAPGRYIEMRDLLAGWSRQDYNDPGRTPPGTSVFRRAIHSP